MDRSEIGSKGERDAEKYLSKRGLRLLERNARYRSSEIDLVMLDASVLVFVEVRVRRHNQYGGAAESVDQRKRGKLIKGAQLWLQSNRKFCNHTCRFDLLAIDSSSVHANYLWYKDAFRLD